MQPIFAFARKKHIPVLALNVSDESFQGRHEKP